MHGYARYLLKLDWSFLSIPGFESHMWWPGMPWALIVTWELYRFVLLHLILPWCQRFNNENIIKHWELISTSIYIHKRSIAIDPNSLEFDRGRGFSHLFFFFFPPSARRSELTRAKSGIRYHTWFFEKVSAKTRYHKVLKMQKLMAQIKIFAETN